MNFKLLILAAAMGSISCVSLDSSTTRERPPKITKNMPLDDAFDAALRFGGTTLAAVEKRANAQKEWPQIKKLCLERLKREHASAPDRELIHLLQMYQASTDDLDEEVFRLLVDSDRVLARRLGYQVAANLPSSKTRKYVDEKLTEVVKAGEEKEHLFEQTADAVASNQLEAAYSLMREGLMLTGSDSFARAMIRLRPEESSFDLMNYLALAPIEELRQLNQKSVNIFACLVILRHFLSYPVSVNHPKYEHLFLYSVSRNRGLSELANQVLERSFTKHRQHMAFVLVRLPAWIQIAFVENARRNRNPKFNLFLDELRKVSVDQDVVAEINETLRRG